MVQNMTAVVIAIARVNRERNPRRFVIIRMSGDLSCRLIDGLYGTGFRLL